MMIGSNDLAKAKIFYDSLFDALGAKEGVLDPKGRLIYVHDGAVFLVTIPIDGAPATVSNGATIGFTMKSADEADRWHAAGVSAGGLSIEDPPGWREFPDAKLYLAYLRDPDGNKLCALYRQAA